MTAAHNRKLRSSQYYAAINGREQYSEIDSHNCVIKIVFITSMCNLLIDDGF